MLQTDVWIKTDKETSEGIGCRASHPLLTAKDGAPSVVLDLGDGGAPPRPTETFSLAGVPIPAGCIGED